MKTFYIIAWAIIFGFVAWGVDTLLTIQTVWSQSSSQHQLRTEMLALADAWRDLNRPGNDVLEKYEVAANKTAFETYLHQFQNRREAVESRNVGRPELDEALGNLDAEKDKMTALASAILDLAEQREKIRLGGGPAAAMHAMETEAASKMARMDQTFQEGLDLILNADIYVVAEEMRLERIQAQNFRRLYIMLVVTLIASALSVELLRRTIRHREALVQTNARIHSIVSNVADGIVTVDHNGSIESVNSMAAGIFGYTESELVGRHFSTLLSGGGDDRSLEYLKPRGPSESAGADRGEFEEIGRRKNGSTFPMELAMSEVEIRERAVLIYIVRDITERKRAEEELRQAAIVFQNTTEGILITDPRSRILTVNPAFTAITGYTPEEAVGKTPRILSSGRQDRAFYREMWARIGKTGHWQGEVWNRRKNGEIYPQWLNISAVVDRHGRTTHYVGVTWDISPLKASERMKDEFIATVSHELRTPLTSIRGSLGLIAGGVTGEIPQPARKLVGIAYENSERLVRLINDILDLEKMQAGKMVFRLRPLDLVAQVEQAVEANRAYASELGVSFAVQTRAASAMVLGDGDRIMQVMTNLLSNAAKFSPRGGQVKVALRNEGDMVRVSVTDHGPGVPEEFRPHLFKRFAQADASITRAKSGTGLGLHICRLIVEKLEGRIDFESTPDVATTFFFQLPLLRDGNAVSGEDRRSGGVPSVAGTG